MMTKKILLLAGEPSGDLHGSNLALELKRNSPNIEILGTGGEKMKNAGVDILFDLKTLAVTGLLDVIKNYSKLKKIQTSLLSKIKEENIDLIILIDYPDFNLRFAKKAHRFGVPIVYYISPQIWAWRKERIKLIKKYIRKIFVIFKFEEGLYKKEGIDVEFIGHPLLDIVRPRDEGRRTPVRRSFSEGGKDEGRIIALLPGSRNRLVKTLLPVMLKASGEIYRKLPDVKFLLSKSPSVDRKIYEKALSKAALPITLIEGNAYELINACDFVLCISGTSTLETAILGKPMAVIYKLPILEYVLAKPLLRLRNIGLVNIVAGEEVVCEFIQFKARPQKIAEYVVEVLTDKSRYNFIKNRLADVKKSLYPDGASRRAALSILKFFENHTTPISST
jgi:lipid-A-disaccharide synthase